MKKLILLLTLAVFAGSCVNLNKLVEEGRYNEAIDKAVRKLRGDKKKKTKHVLALEEAVNKINDRDLRKAKFLESGGKAENWDEIFDIYSDMQDRQEMIRPLLPLVSKDGYKANFNFVKVEPLVINARKNAAEYHYKRASSFLGKAERGDKQAARTALESLDKLKSYYTNYKDADELSDKAQYLGKLRIQVKLVNKAPVIIPKAFEQEVLRISVRDLNTRLKEFYLEERDNIDVLAQLTLEQMEVSPERENVHHFDEEKEIKDGWEYVLDDRGNVIKDSLGNDIKQDKYVIVRAHIDEIRREKRALVRATIKYVDKHTNRIIDQKPIQVESIFEDFAVQYRGDKRALKDKTRRRVKPVPDPFPSDFDMALLAAELIKDQLRDELKHQFH